MKLVGSCRVFYCKVGWIMGHVLLYSGLDHGVCFTVKWVGSWGVS